MARRKSKKSSPKLPNAADSAVGVTTWLVSTVARRAELLEWLNANDPLYDRTGVPPVTISELLSTQLSHPTFTAAGVGEQSYNWSKFRSVLEGRTADSPRWFMQIREEDLLVEGGLDGVTVDCVVIAEASQPTLSPAHYIVKQHLPFSDLEDNAPERILPIEGQNMFWRRVVRDDGANINAFLLQKRDAAPNVGFTSGATVAPSVASSSTTAAARGGFNFGFGAAPASGGSNSFANSSGSGGASMNFGFGTTAPTAGNSSPAAPATAGGFSFGFGGSPAVSSGAPGGNGGCPIAFGFGAPGGTVGGDAAQVSGGAAAGLAQSVSSLKASEVLFALWSTKRLTEMSKSLKSGSRIVREGFRPNPTAAPIKLVVQNDLKDDVTRTVKQLVLNKLFAKQCPKVKAVDQWIDGCPVYEEHLAAAVQKFRGNYIQEVAEASEEFRVLYEQYREPMEAELRRIIAQRKEVIDTELETIGNIMRLVKEKKIAEKHTFRLLKYYAANDIVKFRPFGKVSGVSEMGESADVCEPPAPVLVNPFMTSNTSA